MEAASTSNMQCCPPESTAPGLLLEHSFANITSLRRSSMEAASTSNMQCCPPESTAPGLLLEHSFANITSLRRSSMQASTSNMQYCPPESTAPWLLLEHFEDQTFYVLSPLPSDKYYYTRNFIPELSDHQIIGCYHGWLLLFNESNRICLFDLLSVKMILLPKLEQELEVDIPSCGLTAPPDDFNCLVLLFDEDRAMFCRPGIDDHWTVQTTRVEDSGKEIEIKQLITCKGVIYAGGYIGNKWHLVSIEVLNTENDQPQAQQLMIIRSLELGRPFAPIRTFRLSTYLVESCGEVFTIGYHFNLQDIHHVEVYRLTDTCNMDSGRMIWAEVENLRNRVFFIGTNCNASLWMTSSHESVGLLRENSIYFTFDGDKAMYRYSLEDRSLTPFSPCLNLPKLVGCPNFWVLPPLPNQQRSDNRHAAEEDCKNFVGKGTIQMQVMTTTHGLLEEDVIEEECETDESFISELPLDIIGLFARRLSLRDYLKFRTVCKSFLKAAPRIDWMPTSVISEDHTDFTPSLLFLDRSDGTLCNLSDPSSRNQYLCCCNTSHAFFKRETITFSQKGWLLLESLDATLQLFNPITGMAVEYPRNWLQGAFWGFSTFHNPHDCVIVGMQWNGEGSEFCYIHHGEEDWNYYYPESKAYFAKADNTPVFYDGVFYYLDRYGKLGAFELTENECSWKILKKKSPCKKVSQENYLVECDGVLLSIFVGKLGRWIQVFRLHLSTMTWEKVQNLGGHMLFLGRVSSFSMPAICAGMENRIYFLRFLGGNAIYYSLDTGKYYPHGIEYPVEDFCNSRQLLQSCWIQPTLS